MLDFLNKTQIKTLSFYLVLSFLLSINSSYSFGKESFDSAGSSPESLNFIRSQSHFGPFVSIVQKQLFPKKHSSELSLAITPALKGLVYLNSFSLDASYRFYLNHKWSLHAKYSFFLNTINPEGDSLILSQRSIPLEVKYAQKQAGFIGLDYYLFYGKTNILNQIIYFNIYLSGSVGAIQLIRLDDDFSPLGSVAGGLVFWWNKRFNTRWELRGSSYKYQPLETEEGFLELISHTSVSIGVLF